LDGRAAVALHEQYAYAKAGELQRPAEADRTRADDQNCHVVGTLPLARL
jgi:hypothetical protein